MWSPSSIDLENVDLVLDHQKMITTEIQFEPNPYTFTKIENGKKTTADCTSLSPPSWLLLDHSIAVIWAMFSLNSAMNHLSIDDLKWAYEFLKEVKNKKGENSPDVKVCLKEIQDRLITLYAKLTSMKEVDFDEIAAVFGEKIIEDSTTNFLNTTFMTNTVEPKFEALSISSLSRSPLSLMQKHSSKDIAKMGNGKTLMNCSKKTYSLLEAPDTYEGPDPGEDEEVEKYVLSLFENDKKEESLQVKPSSRSLIPMKKKTSALTLCEESSSQDTFLDGIKKENTCKRVHCVAEMRSLKFQKSMKVKDTNGEEAAYSNLKAEIQRLTINPKVSKHEVMKFVKDWRSEQMERLHKELKKLSSIEEFMKNLNSEEVQPNLPMNLQLKQKQLEADKSNYKWRTRLLP